VNDDDRDAHELLEVLDADGQPTGRTKARGAVHRDGDWHRAFHLWVLHPDGSVLLQRRSATKDLAAGRVDVSVAGHVRPGVLWVDALREAEEEIGLVLRPADVDFVHELRSERRYPDGRVDREFQDVYACVVPDHELRDYAPACDEVAVLYQAPLERALALYREGTPLPVAGWDCMRRTNDALLVVDDLIAEARTATAGSLEALGAWWRARSAPTT
jgi:isopentenyldiphosphate isomerase